MKVATRHRSGKSDGELLIAAGAGDRRALEELYLGYQRRLARFLSRFTRRGVIVEEIINDTFVVVWRHANEFRFASQVSSWIFSIAYRVALKSIRRERNHCATRSLDECPEQTVDPMLEAEVQDWVMHGLNRLPDEQAVTLQLAYLIGHSLVEIAEITGAPVGTVKARMFHARKKLRRHLPILGGGQDNWSCQANNIGPNAGTVDSLCRPQNGGNPRAAVGSYVGARGPVGRWAGGLVAGDARP
jgi:RNA polymerase sigma-70 factor (ECF subfamily)